MKNAAQQPECTVKRFALLSLKWKPVVITAITFPTAYWAFENYDWSTFFQYCHYAIHWGRIQLQLDSGAASPLWIMTPAILVAWWAITLRTAFETPPNWVRILVSIVFVILQLGYLTFRLVATLNLDTPFNAVFSLLFFASEVFLHVRIILGYLSLFRLTNRSAQADVSAEIVRSGKYLPTVDVFIPTYSEPMEMLERSIIGCQAMTYPNKTIWLLDDRRRPLMRALAQRLGCRYMDRPDNSHAKAGNLNHALKRTRAELVVSFDADFIPTRDFLERTIGFFLDPKVALVQTPQHFFNQDAVQRNLGLERVIEGEQTLFFRVLQPGRDTFNAIVCHGTSWVARRSALEEIGLIPTETITEDWATSIKLQAVGYKLLYLNEALSAGLAADTCGEFIQQDSRWAQGTLQGIFASTNPLTIPGLNWKQRVLHFSGILYYAGSACTLFNLLAPLFYLFLGIMMLRMSIAEMLFFRLPFILGYYMLYSWLTLGYRSPFWTELYETFFAPSIGLTVLWTMIRPFGATFRVTNKTRRPRQLTLNLQVSTPFIILIALHLIGLALAFFTAENREHPELFGIILYFTLGNLPLLWICLLASMDIHRSHPFRRFKHALDFQLSWDSGSLRGKSLLLSENEITLKSALPFSSYPAEGLLQVTALRWENVPVRVSQDVEGTVNFIFRQLTLLQRRALIEQLYCQPGQWMVKRKSDLRAIWEYLRAGLRMYPLAESV
jgi:cellulose synthase (UDP-forming)